MGFELRLQKGQQGKQLHHLLALALLCDQARQSHWQLRHYIGGPGRAHQSGKDLLQLLALLRAGGDLAFGTHQGLAGLG